jgi:hypothetical protein
MLLVDHRQTQIVEDDIVLEQRMGADGDLDRATGQGPQLLGPGAALVPAGQQDCSQALSFLGSRQGLEMLAGEDFGGRHQGSLAAGLRHIGHGQHGHDRLA